MSWTLPGREIRFPAREYVDHINRIGGMNRYGQPNFKIVWGQTETMLVYGRDEETGRVGQHVKLKHDGIPAWFIDVWKPPECYGTRELWYALTWDWENDLPTCGEYPERGGYEPAPFNLFVRHFDQNVMIIDAMPLTHWIIDFVTPNLLKEKESTFYQRKQAILARLNAEKAAAAQKAFDAYYGGSMAFGGAAGTHESNRQAWETKILAKQLGMKISRDEAVAALGLGHRQIRTRRKR